MKIEEELNKELEGKDKELIKEAKKIIKPAVISQIYGCLCNQCKAKAIHRRQDFCPCCMEKVEKIISDSYN